MTKAQRRTRKAVATILEAAGIKQSQLAELIGVSLDTVKSWTRKKNPNTISPELETRILIGTGAEIRADGSVFTSWRVGKNSGLCGKPYSKAAFEFWVEKVNPIARLDGWIEVCQQGIELLLKAATKGHARIAKQNNFSNVLHAFESWISQTAKDFNLERAMLSLSNALPKEKRFWRINPNKLTR